MRPPWLTQERGKIHLLYRSRNVSGIKTTTGVSVEPTSGMEDISPTPSLNSLGSLDKTRGYLSHDMDSTTTIASSITSPIAAAIPPRVIMLKLSPAQFHGHGSNQHGDRYHYDSGESDTPVFQEQVI